VITEDWPGDHIEPCFAVIVAEDDVAFRFLLGEALREEGFEILSATNGTEALELYRKNTRNIALAIVDVTMPGMDGITAATEMRKVDDNVFFLFINGYERERLKERGINMEDIPNADFLFKPFKFKGHDRQDAEVGLIIASSVAYSLLSFPANLSWRAFSSRLYTSRHIQGKDHG
jgi:CheY-like chemotaxis protein